MPTIDALLYVLSLDSATTIASADETALVVTDRYLPKGLQRIRAVYLHSKKLGSTALSVGF